MLHDARGTSFENPDTSRVSIGTIVRLRNEATNNEETYTILGAWDGDPDRHIISYQTAIGQALLGHAIRETVSLNTDDGVRSICDHFDRGSASRPNRARARCFERIGG